MKSYRYDGKSFSDKRALYDHIEKKHGDELKNLGWDAGRYWFFVRYGKTSGRSVISGKETPWNPVTERYERFADEAERQQYREEFKRRMLSKYGKVDLADDPEHQKKMLASRSITVSYRWRDGTETKVTGEYEKHFLHFAETVYGFRPVDFTEPPTFYYVEEGKKRFYLPDFYIPSMNLIVEIKGGNAHYQTRDAAREVLKKQAVEGEGFGFVQVDDKLYTPFHAVMQKALED